MSKNRILKEQKVKEIQEKMKNAESIIISKYQGLTVEEDTKLRKELREAGVEYKVYKNTLAILAAKELGYENIIDYFKGPVSLAFGHDDPIAPARILNKLAENNDKFELKAGLVNGDLYDENKIKELAKVPPKEVLLTTLLCSFKAPISKFVCVVNAIKEQKEQQEQVQ